MSGYVVGTLLGALMVALTTVLIFALTGRREERNRARERNAAQKAELQRAMREYLAALDAAVIECERQLPRPRPSRVDRWVERTLEGTTVDLVAVALARLLERALFGRRSGDVTDRIVTASAHLRLVAPDSVEALMAEAQAVTRKQRPGNENWQNEWTSFRLKLRQGFREALDGL